MGATPALTPAFPALVVTSLWNFPQFHSSHTLSAAFSTPWSAHLPIPIPFVLQHLWFPAGHRSKGERRTLGHKEGTGLRVTGDPLAGIQRCLNPRTPSTYSLAAPSWSAPPPGTWPPHCPALAPTGGLGFGPSRGWAIWAFCYPLVSRWSQGPTPGLA